MVKDVLMIDVDSKFGILYLMQLSTYHKNKGDRVYFKSHPDPDVVYVSCLFKKNGGDARGIATYFPEAEVHIGGTGIDLNGGDPKIAKLKPDYDLYPNTKWAIGRTTWGCPNECGWCVVPQKEGKLQRWMHPSEFYDDRFDTIYLLDNNISYDKKWFMEVTDWILEKGLKIKEGGMDFRYLDQEIADRLKELRFEGQLHFAWDTMGLEKKVVEGIEILKKAGIRVRSNITVYILTGHNTTPSQDLYRCETLRKLNTKPFIMQYTRNAWTRELADWVNRPETFWSCEFKDLKRKNRYVIK